MHACMHPDRSRLSLLNFKKNTCHPLSCIVVVRHHPKRTLSRSSTSPSSYKFLTRSNARSLFRSGAVSGWIIVNQNELLKAALRFGLSFSSGFGHFSGLTHLSSGSLAASPGMYESSMPAYCTRNLVCASFSKDTPPPWRCRLSASDLTCGSLQIISCSATEQILNIVSNTST